MSAYPPPSMQMTSQYGGGSSPPPRPNGGFSYGLIPPPRQPQSPTQPQPPQPPQPPQQPQAQPQPLQQQPTVTPPPVPASPSGQYGPAAPSGQFSPRNPPGPPAPSGQYPAPQQYGAPPPPSGQYGAPLGQYAAPAPAPAPAPLPGQYSAAPAQYGAPPPPSGQYGPPGQYAAPVSPTNQYAAPGQNVPQAQYTIPPGHYVAPPGLAAPPGQYAMPPPPYGQPAYGAAPVLAINTPPPGQNVDIRLNNGGEVMVLNPPVPYNPTPLDSSVSSKFTFQNNSLTGSERNFTAAPGVSIEEIKQFFMFHAGAPEYKIKIIGWHNEKTLERQQDGSEREVERRKNDWETIVDPTKWFQCPGTISKLDDSITAFLKSSKSLRKVTLHKRVNFDLNGFLNEIKNIVGKRGWREQTEAHIEWKNHSEKLALHAAGGCHDVCDSTLCKCLLFATCLCICWSPMKALCFEDHSTIYEDINLSITPHEFAKSIERELPQSFRGLEAQINEQRREEKREEEAYQRKVQEEQRRERLAEERREEQQWEAQHPRQEITIDYVVQEPNGTIVEEKETIMW